MLNLLTDIPGVAVGHATDLALGSGVTAIVFAEAAVASVSVLGGAPGSRDTTMLEPEMTVERVDAIVLSGGSVFGLDAAGGALGRLREQGRGTPIGPMFIPIVPQAILFDLLNGGNKDLGPPVALSRDGLCGGRGGAIRPLRPRQRRRRHRGHDRLGQGRHRLREHGHARGLPRGRHRRRQCRRQSAGRPRPHFWAAPFERDGEFGGLGFPAAALDAEALSPRLKGRPNPQAKGALPETGTTIGLVVTDAPLTKAQAKRLAIAAQDGLARAVLSAHLPFDGDTMFAASTGTGPAVDAAGLGVLCHEATIVTARAIARGVFEATVLPYPDALPDWHSLFR